MRLVTALAAFALVSTAQAGLYVESEVRDQSTKSVRSNDRMFMQDGHSRMEHGQKGNFMLFKDDGLYFVDNVKHSYRVMDKATMEQMSAKMNDAMAKMKAQMAGMPPERRAMMEKMMSRMNGQQGAGAAAEVYDAIDTGKSETSYGRSCHLWNVTRNGELEEQYCVAPKGSLPGADEFTVFAKKMSAYMEQVHGPMQSAGAGLMKQHMAVLEKVKGFPIITRHFAGGKIESEETVVKTWESRSIPASQFEVPAGYTRTPMMAH